jgi:hypothetical protein
MKSQLGNPWKTEQRGIRQGNRKKSERWNVVPCVMVCSARTGMRVEIEKRSESLSLHLEATHECRNYFPHSTKLDKEVSMIRE